MREEAGAGHAGIVLAAGSGTRIGHSHSKVYLPLAHLAADIRGGRVAAVLIHDAARPLASLAMTERVLAAALRRGAAVPGVPAESIMGVDPVGRLSSAGTHGTERLVTIQTPQAFRAGPLLAAHEAAARDGFAGTDTAACVERYGELEVAVVPGDPGNLKITFPDDLLVAERLLTRGDHRRDGPGRPLQRGSPA